MLSILLTNVLFFFPILLLKTNVGQVLERNQIVQALERDLIVQGFRGRVVHPNIWYFF